MSNGQDERRVSRRFRKKPVVVDAVRVRDVLDLVARAERPALPPWLKVAFEECTVMALLDRISIVTLEGRMVADRDDWIICGVKGELYPCKPDVFAATYEEVDDER